MPSRYDKDRSFRDMDRNKDRSAHRQPDRPKMSKHKQAKADLASKSYKSKLDAFFSGDGKVPEHAKAKLEALEDTSPAGKARAKALEAIKDAATSSAADAAVDKYLAKWETLPPDYDVLVAVLGCGDEEHVESALDEISALLADNRPPKRTGVLEQRLRRVRSLADDPDIADKAEQTLKALRVFS